MNEAAQPVLKLSGLVSGPSLPPQAKAAPKAPARVKPIDRSQLVWRTVDVEHLIAEDHPARAIWALSGELDLQAFYQPIAAVQGVAGCPPWDPRLLVSLWVYAYSRGISSAREIARRCACEPAFQWLCGLALINHHTLSDFRVAHAAALQELFVEVLGVLSAEGLVSLERVMHDGTKIKACASADTFRREERLRAHLEAARQQVQSLAQESPEEPTRQQAAQQRAARERQERVQHALEQLEQIRQTKPAAKEKAEVRVSTTEPEARIMKQADGGFAPSYNAQLSTEASHKIIVGVGLSQNSSDSRELVGGVERVQENLQHQPGQVVADGGFTSRENILAMAAAGIDFIGSFGEQQAKGRSAQQRYGASEQFVTSAFEYDAQRDEYRCPAGKLLQPIGQQERIGLVQHVYRAEVGVCPTCQFQAQCCPQSRQGRTVTRSVDAPQVQQFRQ
ncbi:MAG TPA: IS1182 family transposase, partial [Candidatus Sulfotelmatobacter sp.]|nr:IS1182 family transposase [Candidatus Sulfotelmatobacter sp.]